MTLNEKISKIQLGLLTKAGKSVRFRSLEHAWKCIHGNELAIFPIGSDKKINPDWVAAPLELIIQATTKVIIIEEPNP